MLGLVVIAVILIASCAVVASKLAALRGELESDRHWAEIEKPFWDDLRSN